MQRTTQNLNNPNQTYGAGGERVRVIRQSNFWQKIFLLLIAGAVLVGLVWYVSSSGLLAPDAASAPKPDSAAYQAVFLDNGQVYFGKLEVSGTWLILREVYYLLVSQNLQSSEMDAFTQGQNFELVKLGSELHGPEDVMYIPRERVNFWENLKPDSRAVQAIEGHRGR